MAPKTGENQGGNVEYSISLEGGDMHVDTRVVGDGKGSFTLGQTDTFNALAHALNPDDNPLNGDFDIFGGGVKVLGLGFNVSLQWDYKLGHPTVDLGFGVPGAYRSGTLFDGKDDFTNDFGNFSTGGNVSALGFSVGGELGLDYRTDEFGRVTSVVYGGVDALFISIGGEGDITDESWIQDGKRVDRKETTNGDLLVQVTDVNTGEILGKDIFVPHKSGGFTPLTSVRNGLTYQAGVVQPGYELSALDQIAHENHIKASISSATSPAPSSNGGTERRSSDGGNKGDGGGTKTGGNGTSKKHSVPSDTGYASKGVNNLEGLEAAGAGPISLYHRHGSGPDCRSWNT